ncbi:MAG: Trk system potassium transporter TrkA [archaeon]|nr:Trk system potassium transporter TrkA [archaeon]
MNIIIVGAGNVGYTCAQVLSQFHNVMAIEVDKTTADNIKDLLNVSTLCENGVNPNTLEEAFKRQQPEVIISATEHDEDNLFIAMISKHIKPEIVTIATIRNPDFMTEISSKVVDKIISPELAIANKIAELSLLENAIDYDSIESMNMSIVLFEVTDKHVNIIGKVVIDLEIPRDCTIVCVCREDTTIVNCETIELHVGDKITVLGTSKGVSEFNKFMGITHEASEFVIVGGGFSGLKAAKLLESRKKYVKILETNTKRCNKLVKEVNDVVVVNGSGIDPHILQNENIGKADVLMAMTNRDETNLLSCLIGIKLGAAKIISRYSMPEYADIFDFVGIKSAIGTHRIVANEITKILISDKQSILEMRHSGEKFFTITVESNSKIRDQHMGDIHLPEGVRITCIVRNEEKIYPRMDTEIHINDILVMFTYNVSTDSLEKIINC